VLQAPGRGVGNQGSFCSRGVHTSDIREMLHRAVHDTFALTPSIHPSQRYTWERRAEAHHIKGLWQDDMGPLWHQPLSLLRRKEQSGRRRCNSENAQERAQGARTATNAAQTRGKGRQEPGTLASRKERERPTYAVVGEVEQVGTRVRNAEHALRAGCAKTQRRSRVRSTTHRSRANRE